MGWMHKSLNFLKVIGKYVQSSGLLEAWVESKILGPGTAELVLMGKGKSYAKAMLTHKQTIQAIWRILMPKLVTFTQNEAHGLRAEIEAKTNSKDIEELLLPSTSNEFRDSMAVLLTSQLQILVELHGNDEACDDLQNISTQDIATNEIESDLLGAHSKGQEELNNFIQERFISPGSETGQVPKSSTQKEGAHICFTL
ncbi:hypothetical protein SK128_008786 [Halocaridina rubra]|uniref:Uncharacterized protein n=1 Tax=Halocaridina rubra TaxID=373956 RepID=A0AAN9AE74_HALRR